MLQKKLLSVLGVGFGPANLALATAIAERQKEEQICKCLFLEQSASLCWHPDMLLPGSKLQVPFLRDLATLRNPCSPYTFLNYLKAHNRLDEFINLRTFYPSRLEFYDYLQWVSQQLALLVNYNCHVERLTPLWDESNNHIEAIRVTYDDKVNRKLNTLDAKNVVLAIGKKPYMPICANQRDARIIHTSEFLQRIKQQFPESQKEYRFIVIGRGQSAGEAVQYLLNHYPAAKIKLCFRSYTLRGIDSSPYVNLTYHQAAVDEFYLLGEKAKKQALGELKHSNYSVIDNELLAILYEYHYASRLQKNERFFICPGLQIKAISCSRNQLEVVFDKLFHEGIETHVTDGVIFATGYTSEQSFKLLDAFGSYLIKNTTGNYKIARDYRLESTSKLRAGIYVQGNCEESHGPSDGTLAILATRAEEILNSLLATEKDANREVCFIQDKLYAD